MTTKTTKVFDDAEKIGVIGSPSSTSELTIDVLGTAVEKKLVGSLCFFDYLQDGREHDALGQITEIQMKNVWTEDPTMRGLIRQKGRVDPITGRQDTHTAVMNVSAVFALEGGKFDQSMLGTVPSTGTAVKIVNETVINTLLEAHKSELFYLGNIYGNPEIKMPTWFGHFDKPEEGRFGLGEAYHLGIFGKTGSGKSYLAKMMLVAYARHPELSIFIFDPQGEFADSFSPNNQVGKFLIEKLGREVKIFTMANLVFDFDKDLFKDLLVASGFFDQITISPKYEEHVIRTVSEILKALRGGPLGQEIKPWEYYKQKSFNQVCLHLKNESTLKKIIRTPEPRERVKRAIEEIVSDAARKEEVYQVWAGITNIFKYREKHSVRLSEVCGKTKEKGTFFVVDLSEEDKPEELMWNEEIKNIAVQQFLNGLVEHAGTQYKIGGNINSLIVIDEAHRLAPRYTQDEDVKKITALLKDAVRTTRKYGLGWMFISQTLSSLDKEILGQMRVYAFGFGLGWGTELSTLKEIIGGAESAIRLYQLFKDPQSSLGKKEYPFMIRGPISPLSFSDIPLFFNALQYPDEFLKINFGGTK